MRTIRRIEGDQTHFLITDIESINEPAPWESSLSAFLSLVDGQNIDWWLIGSPALPVRGIVVKPRDFDFVVDEAGAKILGALLIIRVSQWFPQRIGSPAGSDTLSWMHVSSGSGR